MEVVTVYCDGSSIGNPGPGGWGAVIVDGARVRELGGYDPSTTNNRMELTAAIISLRALKGRKRVTVYTDSRYVINGITKWSLGWRKNDWQTTTKKAVLNKDLWQGLMKVSEAHEVTWRHVRGHAGVQLNERADMIANAFAREEETPLFSGTKESYETFLAALPRARRVASASSKKGRDAYSYISMLNGKVMTHRTWAECETRVKGTPAKFKKVYSREEEQRVVNEWSGERHAT